MPWSEHTIRYDLSLLRQAYEYTLSRREKGTSIWEIGQAFGIPPLEARALCRGLERVQAVELFMWDRFKQREQR